MSAVKELTIVIVTPQIVTTTEARTSVIARLGTNTSREITTSVNVSITQRISDNINLVNYCSNKYSVWE